MLAANERAATAPTVTTLIPNRPVRRPHINPTLMEVTMVTNIMSASRPTTGSSNSERADDYRDVVVRLNADWRVIRCTAGLQYITQRLLPPTEHARGRWVAKSHCRSRADLIGLVARHSGPIEPDAARVLANLPEWIDPGTTAAIVNPSAAIANDRQRAAGIVAALTPFLDSIPDEDFAKVDLGGLSNSMDELNAIIEEGATS